MESSLRASEVRREATEAAACEERDRAAAAAERFVARERELEATVETLRNRSSLHSEVVHLREELSATHLSLIHI